MIQTMLPSEARQTFIEYMRWSDVILCFIIFYCSLFLQFYGPNVFYVVLFLFTILLAEKKMVFEPNNHFYQSTFNLMQYRRKINSTFDYVSATHVCLLGLYFFIKCSFIYRMDFSRIAESFWNHSNQLRVCFFLESCKNQWINNENNLILLDSFRKLWNETDKLWRAVVSFLLRRISFDRQSRKSCNK